MILDDDPWIDLPHPASVIEQAREPRRLSTRALAGVATPVLDRVSSGSTLPVFAEMLHALVGPSETTKSTLAGHVALDVAVRGLPVIVFDGEMSAPVWRRKLVELGATDDDLERIYYAEMSVDAGDVDAVRAEVAATGARLLIWDSALSLISRTCRSENDNSEVGRLFDSLRSIVRDGPAGLIVDHSSKDAHSPVSRGASAKFAALDVSYGIRLADGAVPGPFEPWSALVSVEKDRHALLGARTDREVTYAPLGGGNLAIDIAQLGTSSHRLSPTNPVAALVAAIDELDPAPTSANDAYRRIGGRKTAVLAAYKKWSDK